MQPVLLAREEKEPERSFPKNGRTHKGSLVSLGRSAVVNKIRDMKPGEGLNAGTGTYGDLIADGVIDPTMVTRSALQNAASIAKNILTTECTSLSPRKTAQAVCPAVCQGV